MNRTGGWMLGMRFDDALAYAAELHRDHVRKGTDQNAAGEPVRPTPYLAHLLGVASLALEAGADEYEASAALLHDAIEDRPRDGETEREIGELLGQEVLAIVKGCTKVEVESGLGQDARRARRRETRAAYFEHLRHADDSVLLVSAADKLHNARAIVADLRERGPSMFDRFNDDREGTLWYYRGVLEALREAGAPRRLVDALDAAVAEMHRLSGADGTSEEDESESPFVPTGVEGLPSDFAYRVVDEANAIARQHGLALDASGFAPVIAAVREVAGTSMGVHVIDVRTWRAVGPVRFGGAPALLVAELTIVDNEAAAEVLAREGVVLSIVPFARPTDAEHIALQDAPGHPIPRSALQ